MNVYLLLLLLLSKTADEFKHKKSRNTQKQNNFTVLYLLELLVKEYNKTHETNSANAYVPICPVFLLIWRRERHRQTVKKVRKML